MGVSREHPYIRFPKRLREEKLHEQQCQCALCGAIKEPHELQAHHKKQFQHGGSSFDPENIALVCRKPCHDIVDKDAENGIPFDETLRRHDGVMPSRPVLVKPASSL